MMNTNQMRRDPAEIAEKERFKKLWTGESKNQFGMVLDVLPLTGIKIGKVANQDRFENDGFGSFTGFSDQA